MTGVIVGLVTQEKAVLARHWHTASFGVGGSVDEAMRLASCGAQLFRRQMLRQGMQHRSGFLLAYAMYAGETAEAMVEAAGLAAANCAASRVNWLFVEMGPSIEVVLAVNP